MISDLYLNPRFFCHFLRWKNAARLFFNLIDVIFLTLVKFRFVGFYISLIFLLKPFTYPTYTSKYVID